MKNKNTDRISKKELREQKKQNAEHQKEIARLNKMLVSVSKNTTASMGLVSIEPQAGVFCFENDRWVGIYRMVGFDKLSQKQMQEFFNIITSRSLLRFRITSIFVPETGAVENYLSIIGNETTYEAVKNKYDEAISVITGVLSKYAVSIETMSVNAVMQQIQKNYGLAQSFEYSSAIRGKKDWKKMVFDTPKDMHTYFEHKDSFGSVYYATEYSKMKDEAFLSSFKNFGLPMVFVADFQSLDADSITDFKRSLELKYNRNVVLSATSNLINVTFMLSFLATSQDMMKTTEDTMLSIFANKNITLSPAVGNEVETLESIYSMGLVDFHAMRNVTLDKLPVLVLTEKEEEHGSVED